MSAPFNDQLAYIEKPLDDSGSTDNLNDLKQGLQYLEPKDTQVKQHHAILTYGDPAFNEYLVVQAGMEAGKQDISNYLVLPACLLGSDAAVNYCCIMPEQKPVYVYNSYSNYDIRGFIGFNLPAGQIPSYVYVVHEIEAAFKLSACKLPCVLIPPVTGDRKPIPIDNQVLQRSYKAIISALEAQGVQVYAPVATDDKGSLKTLLRGNKAHVLALPEAISQYIDNSIVTEHLLELKTLADQQAKKAVISEWGALQPINEQVAAKANTYPIQALPQRARGAVEAIAHYVQVPHAMAAQCVLAALSHIAQGAVNAPHRHCETGTPCSLFILTEGQSGSRKTEAQRIASKAITDIEKLHYDQYKEALQQWQDEQAGMNKKDRAEFLACNPEPLDPSTVFNDATIEPIVTRYINQQLKNASWSTDEAAQFFNGHSMKGDTSGSALGAFTRLFDNGIAERTRSTTNANGSGKAFDCRLTFNLLGQHEILVSALSDPILRGQGFLPRFLFAAPENLAGHRLQSLEFLNQRSYKDSRIQAYWQRCNELLAAQDVPQVLVEGEPLAGRPVITMSQAAKKVWLDFYNQIEQQQGSGQRYEYIQAFASRSGEQAARVATVFAFFDCLTEIDAVTMQNACDVVQYSLDEWVRYSEVKTKAKTDAEVLLEWLVSYCQTDQTDRILRTSIQQKCRPAWIRKKQILDPIIEYLVDTNHIQAVVIANKNYVVLNSILLKPCYSAIP